MDLLEIIILLGMIVSTLLLWFMQYVNNKVCALKDQLDTLEKSIGKKTLEDSADELLPKDNDATPNKIQ